VGERRKRQAGNFWEGDADRVGERAAGRVSVNDPWYSGDVGGVALRCLLLDSMIANWNGCRARAAVGSVARQGQLTIGISRAAVEEPPKDELKCVHMIPMEYLSGKGRFQTKYKEISDREGPALALALTRASKAKGKGAYWRTLYSRIVGATVFLEHVVPQALRDGNLAEKVCLSWSDKASRAPFKQHARTIKRSVCRCNGGLPADSVVMDAIVKYVWALTSLRHVKST